MTKALLTLIFTGSCLLAELVSCGSGGPSSGHPVVPIQSRRPVPVLAVPSPRQEAIQTIFGAEEELKHPVDVPEDVLRILKQDERIQTHLGNGQSNENLLKSWFAASEIDLNDDDTPELVVRAVNPHLFGANLVPFWIFRKGPKGHELILSVNALGLEVLRTKTNGYKNIVATKSTAREILSDSYGFDLDKYERQSSARKVISP